MTTPRAPGGPRRIAVYSRNGRGVLRTAEALRALPGTYRVHGAAFRAERGARRIAEIAELLDLHRVAVHRLEADDYFVDETCARDLAARLFGTAERWRELVQRDTFVPYPRVERASA